MCHPYLPTPEAFGWKWVWMATECLKGWQISAYFQLQVFMFDTTSHASQHLSPGQITLLLQTQWSCLQLMKMSTALAKLAVVGLWLGPHRCSCHQPWDRAPIQCFLSPFPSIWAISWGCCICTLLSSGRFWLCILLVNTISLLGFFNVAFWICSGYFTNTVLQS